MFFYYYLLGVVDNISAGDYSVVFSSPEAALLPGIWRRSFTSGLFNDHSYEGTNNR